VVLRCHDFGGGHENALRESGIGNAGGRRARLEPTSIAGEQFQRDVVKELTTWTEIVEKAGIKPQ
jgi:hypothetical protein